MFDIQYAFHVEAVYIYVYYDRINLMVFLAAGQPIHICKYKYMEHIYTNIYIKNKTINKQIDK